MFLIKHGFPKQQAFTYNIIEEFHPISYILFTNQIPLSLHLPVFGVGDRFFFFSGNF